MSEGVRAPSNLSLQGKAHKLGHSVSYSAAWQLLVGNARSRIQTLVKSMKIWQGLQKALDFAPGRAWLRKGALARARAALVIAGMEVCFCVVIDGRQSACWQKELETWIYL